MGENRIGIIVDINDMTRPHGLQKGMTVEQLKNVLGGMPPDMEVVVEGGKLIDAHCIIDVLPNEPDEGYPESAAANTISLSIGHKWTYTQLEEIVVKT